MCPTVLCCSKRISNQARPYLSFLAVSGYAWFDWEWLLRARQSGVTFLPDDQYLSVYRIHEQHKSGTGGERRRKELAVIYGRHAGARYERLYSRCCASKSLAAIRKWIRLARLTRIESRFLKLAFPWLFHGFKRNEVRDVITML